MNRVTVWSVFNILRVAPTGYWLLVAGRWYLAFDGGKKKTAKDYNEPFKKSSGKMVA